MSEKNLSKDKYSKNNEKETSFNLVKTIMSNSNIKDINQSNNYTSHLQMPPNIILNQNTNIVINSETKTVDDSQRSVADKSLDDTTILMSINGTIGNLAYYSGEKLMLGKSAAYIKVSEFDKKFVYAYLQAPSVKAYFMDSLTGTTIKNLGLKAIREMKIIVPHDIEEQNKIGEYFSNLDNLITLHQRKCNHIQIIII